MIHSIIKCQLTLPCPSRWNSFYDSISKLINIERSILNTLMIELKLPEFSRLDYKFLIEYLKVTSPLAIGLDRLHGDINCFYGDLFPILFSIESRLLKMDTKLVYCQPLLDVLKEGLKRRFNDYFSFEYSINSAIIATISNPKFKLNYVEEKDVVIYI